MFHLDTLERGACDDVLCPVKWAVGRGEALLRGLRVLLGEDGLATGDSQSKVFHRNLLPSAANVVEAMEDLERQSAVEPQTSDDAAPCALRFSPVTRRANAIAGHCQPASTPPQRGTRGIRLQPTLLVLYPTRLS